MENLRNKITFVSFGGEIEYYYHESDVKYAVLKLKEKIRDLQDSDYPGQLFHGEVQDMIDEILGDFKRKKW